MHLGPMDLGAVFPVGLLLVIRDHLPGIRAALPGIREALVGLPDLPMGLPGQLGYCLRVEGCRRLMSLELVWLGVPLLVGILRPGLGCLFPRGTVELLVGIPAVGSVGVGVV